MTVWLRSRHMTNNISRSEDPRSIGVTDSNLPEVLLGSRQREEGNTAKQCQKMEHHVKSRRGEERLVTTFVFSP